MKSACFRPPASAQVATYLHPADLQMINPISGQAVVLGVSLSGLITVDEL